MENHNSDITILHKYNFIELKFWTNQLQFINSNVDKLLSLYEQSIGMVEIPKKTLILFLKRKAANKQLLDTVLTYSITYRKILECDDL